MKTANRYQIVEVNSVRNQRPDRYWEVRDMANDGRVVAFNSRRDGAAAVAARLESDR